MHRIDSADAVAGLFSGGDPTVPRLPTQLTPELLNALQEELAGLVLAPAGGALVKANNAQVLAALTQLFWRIGNVPSYTTALVNGLLFATPDLGSGYRLRIYLLSVDQFWVTTNASWDGTHWNRDINTLPSQAIRIGPGGIIPSYPIGFLFHDSPGTAQWLPAAWSTFDTTSATGSAVDHQQMVAVLGGIGFQNSWANKGSGLETAAYMVDPIGKKHLQGSILGGASGTVAFTLPATHRPAAIRYFVCPSGVAGSALAIVSVNSGGDVTVVDRGTNTFVSLDGISFF